MKLGAGAVAAGFSLMHVPAIGSTSTAALEAVQAGRDRHWVVADEQSSGRGRHGRAWASPPGNLYASLGLNAPCPPSEAPRLGFVAGLSLIEAIAGLAPHLGGRTRLKWPNDCLIDRAKCAGILIEGAISADGIQHLAIGIGVNVAHAPGNIGRSVAALAQYAPDVDAAALFAALSARMSHNLALFADGSGFGEIRAHWLAHALPIGERLTVRPPLGELNGIFAGIDEAGHLLLGTDRGVETIMVGDVFLEPFGQAAENAAERQSAVPAAERMK